ASGVPCSANPEVKMIGTPAALARSRKAPSPFISSEQMSFGSSQRTLRSRTAIAVVLASRCTSCGCGFCKLDALIVPPFLTDIPALHVPNLSTTQREQGGDILHPSTRQRHL